MPTPQILDRQVNGQKDGRLFPAIRYNPTALINGDTFPFHRRHCEIGPSEHGAISRGAFKYSEFGGTKSKLKPTERYCKSAVFIARDKSSPAGACDQYTVG